MVDYKKVPSDSGCRPSLWFHLKFSQGISRPVGNTFFLGITQLQQSFHPFGTPLKIQVILFRAPEISDQLKEIHESFSGSGFSHGSGMGMGFPLLEATGISLDLVTWSNPSQRVSLPMMYGLQHMICCPKRFLIPFMWSYTGFLVSQKFFRKPEAFSLCNVTNPPFESIAGYTGYSLGYHPRVEVVWDPPLEGKMLQGMAARVYLLLYQFLV